MPATFIGTPASYLGQAIQEAAPTWKVHPYPYTPDTVLGDRAVVSIFRSEIGPAPGTDLSLEHQVTINVYGAKTVDQAAQDELDGNHDIVLVALQRLPSFTWAKSSATTWRSGTLMGWQITGTVSTSNVYREKINAERANS